ncbi:hypothetical protein HDU96_008967 [Phlyctochytrium bullatum]|nr:hypothetical protein HDU96_008967 [Phlyctochytrium bullatum]
MVESIGDVKRRSRKNNYVLVGEEGRKTGFRPKNDLPRDEFGLADPESFFHSEEEEEIDEPPPPPRSPTPEMDTMQQPEQDYPLEEHSMSRSSMPRHSVGPPADERRASMLSVDDMRSSLPRTSSHMPYSSGSPALSQPPRSLSQRASSVQPVSAGKPSPTIRRASVTSSVAPSPLRNEIRPRESIGADDFTTPQDRHHRRSTPATIANDGGLVGMQRTYGADRNDRNAARASTVGPSGRYLEVNDLHGPSQRLDYREQQPIQDRRTSRQSLGYRPSADPRMSSAVSNASHYSSPAPAPRSSQRSNKELPTSQPSQPMPVKNAHIEKMWQEFLIEKGVTAPAYGSSSSQQSSVVDTPSYPQHGSQRSHQSGQRPISHDYDDVRGRHYDDFAEDETTGELEELPDMRQKPMTHSRQHSRTSSFAENHERDRSPIPPPSAASRNRSVLEEVQRPLVEAPTRRSRASLPLPPNNTTAPRRLSGFHRSSLAPPPPMPVAPAAASLAPVHPSQGGGRVAPGGGRRMSYAPQPRLSDVPEEESLPDRSRRVSRRTTEFSEMSIDGLDVVDDVQEDERRHTIDARDRMSRGGSRQPLEVSEHDYMEDPRYSTAEASPAASQSPIFYGSGAHAAAARNAYAPAAEEDEPYEEPLPPIPPPPSKRRSLARGLAETQRPHDLIDENVDPPEAPHFDGDGEDASQNQTETVAPPSASRAPPSTGRSVPLAVATFDIAKPIRRPSSYSGTSVVEDSEVERMRDFAPPPREPMSRELGVVRRRPHDFSYANALEDAFQVLDDPHEQERAPKSAKKKADEDRYEDDGRPPTENNRREKPREQVTEAPSPALSKQRSVQGESRAREDAPPQRPAKQQQQQVDEEPKEKTQVKRRFTAKRTARPAREESPSPVKEDVVDNDGDVEIDLSAQSIHVEEDEVERPRSARKQTAKKGRASMAGGKGSQSRGKGDQMSVSGSEEEEEPQVSKAAGKKGREVEKSNQKPTKKSADASKPTENYDRDSSKTREKAGRSVEKSVSEKILPEKNTRRKSTVARQVALEFDDAEAFDTTEISLFLDEVEIPDADADDAPEPIVPNNSEKNRRSAESETKSSESTKSSKKGASKKQTEPEEDVDEELESRRSKPSESQQRNATTPARATRSSSRLAGPPLEEEEEEEEPAPRKSSRSKPSPPKSKKKATSKVSPPAPQPDYSENEKSKKKATSKVSPPAPQPDYSDNEAPIPAFEDGDDNDMSTADEIDQSPARDADRRPSPQTQSNEEEEPPRGRRKGAAAKGAGGKTTAKNGKKQQPVSPDDGNGNPEEAEAVEKSSSATRGSAKEKKTSSKKVADAGPVRGTGNRKRKGDASEDVEEAVNEAKVKGGRANAPSQENVDENGRPKRLRLPPLEYWRNERIKYGIRKSITHGFIPEVTDVVRVPKEESPERPSAKKTVSRTVKRRKTEEDSEMEAARSSVEKDEEDPAAGKGFVYVDPDEAMLEEMQRLRAKYTIPIVVFEEEADDKAIKKSEFMTIACPREMIYPAHPCGAADNYFFQRSFQYGDYFGTGFMMFKEGGHKILRNTKEYAIVCFVVCGTAEFQVNRSKFVLDAYGHAMIPRGNTYGLRNVFPGTTLVFFAQAKAYRPTTPVESSGDPATSSSLLPAPIPEAALAAEADNLAGESFGDETATEDAGANEKPKEKAPRKGKNGGTSKSAKTVNFAAEVGENMEDVRVEADAAERTGGRQLRSRK